MFKYYKNKNLVNLSNSILKNFGVETFHPSLESIDKVFNNKRYDKVVVLLFDGMGSSIQNFHLTKNDYLVRHHFDEISSVFPPTTVAATNAFLSGRYPIETGWIGWSQYFPQIDRSVDMFSNNDSFTKERLNGPHLAKTYYQYDSIIDLINRQGRAKALKVFPYGVEDGEAENISDFFSRLKTEMQKNRSHFIYGYWTEPDTTIHIDGPKTYKIHRIVKSINKRIAKLAKECRDNLIIVIADHSLVEIEVHPVNEHLDFYGCIEDNYTLESRCASFRIKPGKENNFLYLFDRYYSDNFKLIPKDLALSQEIFGEGKPHPLIKDILGDYIVVALNEHTFSYPQELYEYSIVFKASHAGGTNEESLIYISVINQ